MSLCSYRLYGETIVGYVVMQLSVIWWDNYRLCRYAVIGYMVRQLSVMSLCSYQLYGETIVGYVVMQLLVIWWDNYQLCLLCGYRLYGETIISYVVMQLSVILWDNYQLCRYAVIGYMVRYLSVMSLCSYRLYCEIIVGYECWTPSLTIFQLHRVRFFSYGKQNTHHCSFCPTTMVWHSRVDMSVHSNTLSWFRTYKYVFLLFKWNV